MTINEALDYIHAVDWRRSSLGLSRIDELLAQMGHPERTMKFVHVTGTNGKGSTCAILASVLRAAGYRTGLYTSPYIFRFNERMQIDGAPISDAELCAVTEEVRPLADGMADHPTEFEMVTAIAFSWFASRKCDIVVCEVGMGGELDATNVIPAPEAAVLCNIGLDHTAYLGDTAEKIAATKSGIIKAGCDAVLYPCAPSVREWMAGNRTGYFSTLESGSCNLGIIPVWRTLYFIYLSAGTDPCNTGTLQDASLCGDDHCTCDHK